MQRILLIEGALCLITLIQILVLGEQMQGIEHSLQAPGSHHRNDHNIRPVSTVNQVNGNDFIHSNQDQQRLHNQWRNQ